MGTSKQALLPRNRNDSCLDELERKKRILKVDWTEPHREDVKAAVRRVLTKQGVKADDFDRVLPVLMTRAEALYANGP